MTSTEFKLIEWLTIEEAEHFDRVKDRGELHALPAGAERDGLRESLAAWLSERPAPQDVTTGEGESGDQKHAEELRRLDEELRSLGYTE